MFEIKLVEKIKIHILCFVTFFWKSFHSWDNVEKCGGTTGAADNMAHAGCLLDNKGYTRASPRPCIHTHTHTQKCVILAAFPQQQWFYELASLLRYTYTACLACSTIDVSLFQSPPTRLSIIGLCQFCRICIFRSRKICLSNEFEINPTIWLAGLYLSRPVIGERISDLIGHVHFPIYRRWCSLV